MATQLRDYRIRAGELDRFVDEWRTGVARLRRAAGFEIAGAWTIPWEDRFVWLLTHLGGWDAFDEADAEYYASPGRAALDPDPARLIENRPDGEHQQHRGDGPGDEGRRLAAGDDERHRLDGRDRRRVKVQNSPDRKGTKPMEQRSLYDRLGGSEAIVAVIEDFVGRCAGDDRINPKFARTDVPRLKAKLVEQVTEATGGPLTYTGRSMPETHDGMGVTAGEFDALVEDLVATLNAFNVPAAEQQELLAILGPLRSDIVEVETPETGTPLPESYRTAAPLAQV